MDREVVASMLGGVGSREFLTAVQAEMIEINEVTSNLVEGGLPWMAAAEYTVTTRDRPIIDQPDMQSL